MCLLRLEVTIAGSTLSELEALAARVAGRTRRLAAGLVHDGRACLELYPKDGCTCEFLKTLSSVQGERLDLVLELSRDLADALELLGEEAERGLAFSTGRVGDPLRHTESVTMRHLVGLLHDKQLGMNTRYRVRGQRAAS